MTDSVADHQVIEGGLTMKVRWKLKLAGAVIGLGVLALPSTASAMTTGFLVEVTFETYRPTPANTSSGEVRNLARWQESGPWPSCSTYPGVPWTSDTKGECVKRVHDGTEYKWADTLLCSSTTEKACDKSIFKKNNNRIILKVFPGDKIRVAIRLRDYDELSASDPICYVNRTHGPFESSAPAQLAQHRAEGMWANNDGGCIMEFSLRKIGTV
ncbi:hypothetical protein IL992_37420 [Microbispora sp. NEAU-D428]|uniref:hypothetical protein n=1 Tax=Microbispora sitophila TaxID=2771537 RepID=UPI001867AFF6|nr:hypothetical protein [Microbispora sitophila]MBE3014817.1 hypothetical protein [Microbispora sitophila]